MKNTRSYYNYRKRLNEELSQEEMDDIEPRDYWDPHYSKEDMAGFDEYSREELIDSFEKEASINRTVADTNLLSVLREEIEKDERERGFLRFRYRGEIYDGIPMAEIDSSKYVFKVNNKLTSVKLAEVKIL